MLVNDTARPWAGPVTGESVRWTVTGCTGTDPDALRGPTVLRSANQLVSGPPAGARPA